MSFGFTEEQQDLAEAIRTLLDKSDADGAWQLLAGQIGLAGLAIPESSGGSGARLAELTVAAAEVGRHLLPCPLLGSTALATTALLAAGDTDAGARLLPPLASGQSVAALAWADESGTWDAARPACRVSPEAAVSGTAHYVLDGVTADVLLVAARTGEGTALVEVDPAAGGVHRHAVSTMDSTRELATIRFDGAAGKRLSTPNATAALREALDAARAVLAAECAGAAQKALELTVEYTTQRTQFGRPIGGFQALKHRMADCHVLVESARALAFEAGRDNDNAAAAKVHCSEALHEVAAEMIQLHGGIAITWEHPAHRYLKRAEAALHLFGGSSETLEQAFRDAG